MEPHLDATAQADLVRSGEVAPRELLEASIERIEALNGELNAVIHPLFEQALEAEPADGPFRGVPFLIKDLACHTAGDPMHEGMGFLRDLGWTEPEDTWLARRFREAGFVNLGKTNTPELGILPTTEPAAYGASRNPWDTERSTGGSSGGSAAAVAAGMVSIAHANDGGGSIRIPASVNGLVGLKPTRNRLAQDKLMRDMPVRIVSDGVVTRSVRDTAAFFREAEKVYRDHRLAPIGDVTRPGRKRLRVALTTNGIGRNASPEVRDLTLETAALLSDLGHEVEEIDPPVPDSFADHFVLYWSMLAMGIVAGGKRAYGPTWDPTKLDNLTLGLARHCRRRLHRLPIAIAAIGASRYRSARHYATYDVTLTPTLATQTPAVGEIDPMGEYDDVMDALMEWVAFSPLANATGEPAISLPLRTTAAGLPQGMMFSAGHGREALLLGLAYELEEACPFARIQG